MTDTLRLVKGGAEPRAYHRQGSAQQIVCRVCEADVGVATSLVVEAVQSPVRRRGKVAGGTKVMVCLHCLIRGKETVL